MNVREKSFTVKQIIENTDSGNIVYDHPMQRLPGQWDIEQKSLFVHSIAVPYAIPQIYALQFFDNFDEAFTILDGKQRLTTTIDFVRDGFALSKDIPPVFIRKRQTVVDENGNRHAEFVNMEYDISNKKFSELDEKIQERITGYQFSVVLLSDCTDEDIENQFLRLNNGTPLTRDQRTRVRLGDELAAFLDEQEQKEIFKSKSSFNNNQRVQGVVQTCILQAVMLLIDECLDVVHKYKKITNSDIQTLFSGEYVTLDENNFLVWNNEKYEEYDGRFNDVRRLCNMKSLMAYKTLSGSLSKILIWNFPVEFFNFFNNSYILTYYWDGSIQKCYFDLHNVNYQHMTLNNNSLCQYDEKLELERRKSLASLIDIYEGKLNDIGKKLGRVNPLCKSWYVKHKNIDNGYLIKKIKNNLENYFLHVVDSPSKDNMYTTFENFENLVKGKSYSKGFVPCNSKGTNDFRDKKVLAYTINLFPNKEVLDFFKCNNIEINQDLYSLCELLQWIWRSQIRDGKPISIYIPSERMRTLLKLWMQCNVMDKIFYDKNKVA